MNIDIENISGIFGIALCYVFIWMILHYVSPPPNTTGLIQTGRFLHFWNNYLFVYMVCLLKDGNGTDY